MQQSPEVSLLIGIIKELQHQNAVLYTISKKICKSEEEFKEFSSDVTEMQQKFLSEISANYPLTSLNSSSSI